MNELLQSIRGVGSKREKSLQKLGIYNVTQLLTYFPRAYEDRSIIYTPKDIRAGMVGSIFGNVIQVQERRPRPRMSVLEVVVGDETGHITAVFFNQGYKKNFYKIGQAVHLYGKAEFAYNKLQMNSPYIETLRTGQTPEMGILPIYSLVEGVSQTMVRQTLREWFRTNNTIEDVIPEDIRKKKHLMNRYEAMKELHFPSSPERRLEARKAMVFEELYVMQSGLLLMRTEADRGEKNLPMKKNSSWVQHFTEQLPFSLTKDQKIVFQQICHDMEEPGKRLQRMVQGDVGSGKTVVAALALLKVIENGYQGALMAPTEILAKQHYETFCNFYGDLPIQIELLTGATKAKDRARIYEGLRTGTVHLLIGTHALIQNKVVFHNL